MREMRAQDKPLAPRVDLMRSHNQTVQYTKTNARVCRYCVVICCTKITCPTLKLVKINCMT